MLKLLEKAPEARPTADEVRATLQEIVDSLPIPLANGARASREMRSLAMPGSEPVPAAPVPQAPPPVSTGSPVTPSRSRTFVAVGVAAGALLLASGMAVLWRRAPAPAPVAAPVAVPETPAMPPPVAPAMPAVAETPAVAEPVSEPAPGPVEVVQGVAPRASGPSRVNTERKPPLLARIERLERKLRASSLSQDEKESARRLLRKARARAESASTASERRQVKLNLDIWERQYLGN